MKKLFCALFVVMGLLLLNTQAWAEPTPIPVDNAFPLRAKVQSGDVLQLHWAIQPSYFLYKKRFTFKLLSPKQGALGRVILPTGAEKSNDILGNYEVYGRPLTIALPFSLPDGDQTLRVQVDFQGCAVWGFCYPPQTRLITANLNLVGSEATISNLAPMTNTNQANSVSAQGKAQAVLETGKMLWILLGFLGFGLLLSFTPCVLPMVPILSSIIVGQGCNLKTRRAFGLSLTYVLTIAITYAAAGAAVSLMGENLQAMLQTPWAIGISAAVLILLALSLFDIYTLQLPATLRDKLQAKQQTLKGGSYVNAALMGLLATLVLSPCVTAPLVGALGYIAHTGDVWLGTFALFALGLGMGLPLLLIGTFGGALLPHAGRWMNTIKWGFGVLLVAMAIWLLARILPGPLNLVLWGALFVITSVYLGVFRLNVAWGWPRFWQGISVILLTYGIILLVGAAQGSNSILQPLRSGSFSAPKTVATFQPVKTIADLDRALAQAQQNNRPVLLDFYADWCVSCQEIEKHIFNNPNFQPQLKAFTLLKADVTANDAKDKALQHHLKVFAPPTLIFFDKQGQAIPTSRLVGDISPTTFRQHLKTVLETVGNK